MKLVKLAFLCNTGAAHHKIGNDLNVGLLHDQDIVAVKSRSIVDLDKYAGLFVICQEFVPTRV